MLTARARARSGARMRRSCVATTSVGAARRRLLAQQRRCARSQFASSRAEVGSSARISGGRFTTARAMATRWASPTERSRARRAASAAMPRPASARRCARRRAAARARRCARRRLSRTSSTPIRCSVCSTRPTWRARKASRARRASAGTSSPATRTLPGGGLQQPGDDAEERALAAARRPEDQARLAVRHVPAGTARTVRPPYSWRRPRISSMGCGRYATQ